MNSKPNEMSLISGGISAEEMKDILGARCVCSSGSATWNTAFPGGDTCACDYGDDNRDANYAIAQT